MTMAPKSPSLPSSSANTNQDTAIMTDPTSTIEKGSHATTSNEDSQQQDVENTSNQKLPPRRQSPLHVDTGDAADATSANGTTTMDSVYQSREIFEERFGKPTRQVIRDFFFKKRNDTTPRNHATSPTSPTSNDDNDDDDPMQQEEQDRLWVENFWRTYDDIIFISLFTQLGMVFRLAAAKWFSVFDNTFRSDSALFVNLPLNCLASFLMGFFGDGPSLMSIVETRFTPQDLQQEIQRDDSDEEASSTFTTPITYNTRTGGLFRRRPRRGQHQRQDASQWTRPNRERDAEMREVQLLALERRIRASPCLVLFPVKKEDVDVMDHYFSSGYQRRQRSSDEMENVIDEQGCSPTRASISSSSSLMATANEEITMIDSQNDVVTTSLQTTPKSAMRHRRTKTPSLLQQPKTPPPPVVPSATDDQYDTDVPDVDRDLDQLFHDVSANISHNIQDATTNITTNISRMRRVSLAEGWDMNTSAQSMSDDLLLGLRDGFCGALSTFSSWSSSMVSLLRNGQVSDAFVGYVIGMELPIVSYRFGQNMAVYLFIWRSRRETRKDERRGGYGIRLPQADVDEEDDSSSDGDTTGENGNATSPNNTSNDSTPEESEMPSVRAIATAIFTLLVVTQLTSLSFFTDPLQHQIALSLFFSPLGVLTRWRISRYNRIISGFPIGTFISNMLGCALSGSLGQLLAGNPGPRERIVLQSLIRGFAGSLSSVSALVVEVLAGTDPLLFRFDGFTYAACTIFWGGIIGLIVQTSLDWAEKSGGTVDDIGRNLTESLLL